MTQVQPAVGYSDYVIDEIWPDYPFDVVPPLPSDDEFPYEDGIPLESNWHRLQMNLLIDVIEYHWRDRHDFFAGGNMFIYHNRHLALNRVFRGPDFFVVKNTSTNPLRKSWIAWKEEGRLPNVIVELASISTIRLDLGKKKNLYEQVFRTPEYFCYDPVTRKLYGWCLERGRYQPLAEDAQGRMVSRELGLLIGPWFGKYLRCQEIWLRLFTPDGHLVPSFSEAEAMRAEAEAQRAEAQAQRASLAEAEIERLKALLAEKGIAMPD